VAGPLRNLVLYCLRNRWHRDVPLHHHDPVWGGLVSACCVRPVAVRQNGGPPTDVWGRIHDRERPLVSPDWPVDGHRTPHLGVSSLPHDYRDSARRWKLQTRCGRYSAAREGDCCHKRPSGINGNRAILSLGLDRSG
jgi:hypothetical protein